MGDRTGEQLGQYRLIQRIGHGGYADIYLGKHVYLPRQAALKVLTASLSEEQVQQFLAEAQTLATLNHPHIIRLLDCAIEQEIPYLVMEYAPTGSLRTLYPHGQVLPLARVVELVSQVADALQYAHERGVIHRDVKPENMLVGSNGEILLSDFGISVIEQTQTTDLLSNSGSAGTPTYMAPEQVLGQPRRASDQYALAVVAYEWLCGQPPFSGNGIALAMQHVHNEIPPLDQRASHLPTEVAQIITRALSKSPDARFPSAREFAQALQQAALNAGISQFKRPTRTLLLPHRPPTTGLHSQEEPLPSPTPSQPITNGSAATGVLSFPALLAPTAAAPVSFHNDPTIRTLSDAQLPAVPSPSTRSVASPRNRHLLAIGLAMLLLLLVAGLVVQLPITITALQANARAAATAQSLAAATAGSRATATAQVYASTPTPVVPSPTAAPASPPRVDGTPVKLPDGLQYIDISEGVGMPAQSVYDTTVYYTGWVQSTGKKFDSSADHGGQPFSPDPSQGVIKGWEEGIPGMKVGGTRRLIIPPELAYGNQAQGDIPANSTLIFDVTLVALKQVDARKDEHGTSACA